MDLRFGLEYVGAGKIEMNLHFLESGPMLPNHRRSMLCFLFGNEAEKSEKLWIFQCTPVSTQFTKLVLTLYTAH